MSFALINGEQIVYRARRSRLVYGRAAAWAFAAVCFPAGVLIGPVGGLFLWIAGFCLLRAAWLAWLAGPEFHAGLYVTDKRFVGCEGRPDEPSSRPGGYIVERDIMGGYNVTPTVRPATLTGIVAASWKPEPPSVRETVLFLDRIDSVSVDWGLFGNYGTVKLKSGGGAIGFRYILDPGTFRDRLCEEIAKYREGSRAGGGRD